MGNATAPNKSKADGKVNTGINDNGRRMLSENLAKLLANSYVLYAKTQGFHWNVTGPHFRSIHEATEEQYEDLAEAVDEIAERIRALGHHAPGTLRQMIDRAEIAEEEGVPQPNDMLQQLVEGHEAIARQARDMVQAAGDVGDEATVDLLTQRLGTHEKTAWMLRSMTV